MSNDKNIPTKQNSLDSKQVEKYLQNHPEFFHEHLNLLENMSIPHPSGNAISLISKQLEIFRSKHHELETQLTGLIEIARENDTSFNKMHELTLALMEAKSVEEVVDNLDNVFTECFLTDYSTLRIITKEIDSSVENIFVHPDDKKLQLFSGELDFNQPKCGKPTLPQAQFLFGDAAKEIKSFAIIPMAFTQLDGIIALGSKEESRFHYSMGNLFLTQMSEIIGTRLISILN